MSDPPRLMNGHGTGFETYLLLAGGDERAPSAVRSNVHAAVDAALGVGVGVGAAVGANSSSAAVSSSGSAAVSSSGSAAVSSSGSAAVSSSGFASGSAIAGGAGIAQGSVVAGGTAMVGGLVSTFLGSAAAKGVVAAVVVAAGSYGASVAVLGAPSRTSVAPAPTHVSSPAKGEARDDVTSLPSRRQGRLVAPPSGAGEHQRGTDVEVAAVDDFESLPRVDEDLDELDAPVEAGSDSAKPTQSGAAPSKAAKASRRAAWRAPARMSTSLSDELALIQRARRYLSYEDHAAALRILDEYDGRYPQGTLKPEAQQLRSVVSRLQSKAVSAK